jgi:hypothetical protein
LAPDDIHENRWTVKGKNQNSKKEFKRTVGIVQESRGNSKVGRAPAKRRQFQLEFRRLGSLSVWLDQEEELLHLAPELNQVLMKKLFQ